MTGRKGSCRLDHCHRKEQCPEHIRFMCEFEEFEEVRDEELISKLRTLAVLLRMELRTEFSRVCDDAAARLERDTPGIIAARMDAEFYPRKYSAKWIEQETGNRTWLPLRECSICGSEIGYVVNHKMVWFRSACGCGKYPPPDRRSSFKEIEDTLAMQDNDEIRDRIVAKMKGEK